MFGDKLGPLLLAIHCIGAVTTLAEGRLLGVTDPTAAGMLDQGEKLYFNKFNASIPLFRYRLWSNLASQEQIDASNSFGYTIETWEIDPYAAIERISFLDLTKGQIAAAEAMGFDEDMWDIFINHFDNYDWKDLVEFSVDEPLIVLGWNETAWNGPEIGYPASEDITWGNLTDTEKQAAADLGYFNETWDKLDFADFVETSLFLNPPPPETDAPSVAPATGGSFGACFSGSARVTIEGKGTVAMDQVELGDHVLVANTKKGTAIYEPIYSFGHYDRELHLLYIQITAHHVTNDLNRRATLEITPDHMIVTHGKGIIPASLVEIGDELLDAKGERMVVQKVSSVSRQGSYAPFTPSGQLVVDGILVSSYVTFQDSGLLKIGGVETPISFQWLEHSFTFPLRLYCKHWSSCTSETYTTGGISSLLDTPRRATIWIFEQDAIVMALSMSIVVILMSVLTILEAVPLMVLALAVAILGGATQYCLKGRDIVSKTAKKL
jgi:hypothetical protein